MRRYQIFISSTYEDLRQERELVIKAVLEMGHIPVGMEMFSAADEEQWKLIARHIRESDYYVVIVAHRYGSTVNGISFTEKEYDFAVEQKIPVLGFVIADTAPWPGDRIETAARDQLAQLKAKVRSKPVAFWTSADDLYGKVAISLSKQFEMTPRPGWIRATEEFDLLKAHVVPAGESHDTQKFGELLLKAREVRMCGWSMRSIFTEYRRQLRELIQRGGDLRILLLNPDSPTVMQLDNCISEVDLRKRREQGWPPIESREITRRDTRYVLEVLEANEIGQPGTDRVHLCNSLLPFRLLMLDLEDGSGWLSVRLYPLHPDDSFDNRITFSLENKESKLWKILRDQFDAAWEDRGFSRPAFALTNPSP